MPTASLRRPSVVVLDVNETLTDMRPLSDRLEDVGAPGHLLTTWFAASLRDGIALTAAGGFASFSEVAAATLTTVLAGQPGLGRPVDEAVAHVLDGLPELPLHPDVAPGVRALSAAGLRVVALTNGGADTAAQVLRAGGVAGDLDHILSVSEVQRWKPAPEPYHHAAATCDVAPSDLLLAAVHPWDIDGARRAGLSTAWIDRSGAPYPGFMLAVDLRVASLTELAPALAALPAA